MVEGAEQPSLAVHRQIPGGPNGRCHVARKDRVIRCEFVHDLRDILRVHRLAPRMSDGQLIEVFANLPVILDEFLKVRVFLLLSE